MQHKLLLLFIGKKVIVDKEEICCSIYGIHGETSLQNDYIKYKKYNENPKNKRTPLHFAAAFFYFPRKNYAFYYRKEFAMSAKTAEVRQSFLAALEIAGGANENAGRILYYHHVGGVGRALDGQKT